MDSFGESKAMLLGIAFPFLTELPLLGWYTLGQFKHMMDKVRLCCISFVLLCKITTISTRTFTSQNTLEKSVKFVQESTALTKSHHHN